MKNKLLSIAIFYWVIYREESDRIGTSLAEIDDTKKGLKVLNKEFVYYIFFIMSFFTTFVMFQPYLLIFVVFICFVLYYQLGNYLDKYDNYNQLKSVAYDYTLENMTSLIKIKLLCNLHIVIFILFILRLLIIQYFQLWIPNIVL